ncbi:hypothetical protein [Paractinoplanes durhamensis]
MAFAAAAAASAAASSVTADRSDSTAGPGFSFTVAGVLKSPAR